jgi:hypothetical protein
MDHDNNRSAASHAELDDETLASVSGGITITKKFDVASSGLYRDAVAGAFDSKTSSPAH